MKRRYTTSQLAEYFGVKRQTIRYLARKYKVPGILLLLGHRKLIRLYRLDEFLKILIRRMKYRGKLYTIFRQSLTS